MGLGNIDINDCNDELQVLIRSSIGGVGFIQNTLTLTANSSTAVLGFTAYKPALDILWVFKNGNYLDKTDYTVSSDAGYISPADGTQWLSSETNPIRFDFIVLKAIPLSQVSIDGDLISDSTLKFSKLASDFMTSFIKNFEDNYKINAEIITNGTIDISKLSTALQTDINDLESHLLYSNPAHVPYALATASAANTYIATLVPTPIKYYDGMPACIKITGADSTAASTINFNTLGARGIKKANGIDITNLKNDGIYTVRYNASTANFILQGEGASGTADASDLRSGKTASVDAGDITGNIPDLNANTYVVQPYDQSIGLGQYINQNQTIKGYPDLSPANILLNKIIGNIIGQATIESIGGYVLKYGTATRTFIYSSDPIKTTVDLGWRPKDVFIFQGGIQYNGSNYVAGYWNESTETGYESSAGSDADFSITDTGFIFGSCRNTAISYIAIK